MQRNSKSKFSTLINVQELKRILTDANLRIFDCRFNLLNVDQGNQLFTKGHIPTSQYADLNLQLAGKLDPNSGRHPLPDKNEFNEQLKIWGIDKDRQIVVYDDASGAIAARMWWLCKWAGLQNVALLNGGFKAWCDDKETDMPISTEISTFNASEYHATFDDTMWISTHDLESIVNNSTNDVMLTDARATNRYLGKQEMIDKKAGHVRGAVNKPFEDNLNDNAIFKSPIELKSSHETDKNVISMCGSGVTACHNILARAHAGLALGQLYVGSWSEWIVDNNRPTIP